MTQVTEITYARSGDSTQSNDQGMRAMQERAYAARDAQYLLLKSPPASGKSRALMFIALDKMANQGIRKTIVAVPERSIAGSFGPTKLKKHGFFADWRVDGKYNLCITGNETSRSKTDAFARFLQDDKAKVLLCTHATLRAAFAKLPDATALDGILLAVDEFHHVSAQEDNVLGEVLRNVLHNSTAHVLAMTGSYFRGDRVAVLHPEDEALFTKVVYDYYEQLNGYQYLKSLGIGYHFYQGSYVDAIGEVLDTDKKTILHIPSVNSGESTKDKYNEVGRILDAIGDVVKADEKTNIIQIKRHGDGRIIRVADLVNDAPTHRDPLVTYLRKIERPEDLDLIIALGMAKEGFSWSYCEHALTVGYRGSLTEIVQIIGRATRDAEGKTHAQFTNLIAQPAADDDKVTLAVNNLLKAITASLLMEQVMTPKIDFKPRPTDDTSPNPKGTVKIRKFKPPSTKRVKDIVESDLTDLRATVLQDPTVQRSVTAGMDPEVVNKVIIPKIIRTRYPDLSSQETEEVRQHLAAESAMTYGKIEKKGSKQFIRMANQFINIEELHIDLIDQINPFQAAYEIIAKSVTPEVLKAIRDTIAGTRIQVSEEEATIVYPKIKAFRAKHGRLPDRNALNPLERRMGEVLLYLQNEKRKRQANA